MVGGYPHVPSAWSDCSPPPLPAHAHMQALLPAPPPPLTLLMLLQHMMRRQAEEYFSMVRRRDCCASRLSRSTSLSTRILNPFWPDGG